MDVSIDDSKMFVDIYTNFIAPRPFSDYNLKVDYGDLFISTNGWSPFGAQPYLSDNASNGETWEFAFDVSTGNLYDISQGAILLAEDVIADSGWVFRNGQEVLIDPSGLIGLEPVSTGEPASYDYEAGIYSLEIVLGTLDWNLNNLGFHWTMTCANDVIEGTIAPVPEPATMLLLGIGLIGLAGLGRKKFFKKA